MPDSSRSPVPSGAAPRRRVVAVALTVAALAAGSAAVPSASAAGTAGPAELMKAASPRLLVDDSFVSDCLTTGIVPIAFRSDRLLVRWPRAGLLADAVATVQAAVNALPGAWHPVVQPLARYDFPTAPGGADLASAVVLRFGVPATAPDQIVKLARGLEATGAVTAAAPDYAYSFESGPVGMWPFGYPQATTESVPLIGVNTGGGVTIALYDTGVPSAAQADLPPNLVKPTAGDTEILDRTGDGRVDLYYGAHSVAIASTIRTIAPQATVDTYKATESDGVATDSSTTGRMTSTLKMLNQQHAWPQIIVAAFGSSACDGLEPVGMALVTEAVDQHDQALIVASAGNVASDRPFYPAAFDGVLAVGALNTSGGDADGNAWTSPTRTGPVASFSNRGAWVDAWAPGVGLVTNHVRGLEFEPGKPINGTARVKGTSYSAPFVAGLLAWQMQATGVDADAAWYDAIAPTGAVCPALGGGIAVALASAAASPTTMGSAPRPGTC